MGPKGRAGLVAALKYVVKESSLSKVDDLLKEREAPLIEIADAKERPKSNWDILMRILQTLILVGTFVCPICKSQKNRVDHFTSHISVVRSRPPCWANGTNGVVR